MENANLKQIAETLVNLTILEARELSRIIREEHGIKPKVQQVHLGFVPQVEDIPEQTEFDVIINSIGTASKLTVVKLVKELTSLGLRESKNLVDSAPVAIKEKVSKSEADEFERQFDEIGVDVEVK